MEKMIFLKVLICFYCKLGVKYFLTLFFNFVINTISLLSPPLTHFHFKDHLNKIRSIDPNILVQKENSVVKTFLFEKLDFKDSNNKETLMLPSAIYLSFIF